MPSPSHGAPPTPGASPRSPAPVAPRWASTRRRPRADPAPSAASPAGRARRGAIAWDPWGASPQRLSGTQGAGRGDRRLWWHGCCFCWLRFCFFSVVDVVLMIQGQSRLTDGWWFRPIENELVRNMPCCGTPCDICDIFTPLPYHSGLPTLWTIDFAGEQKQNGGRGGKGHFVCEG